MEASAKADIFTKNTVSAVKKVTTVKTAKEALVVSLCESGDVNIDRIAGLLGKTVKEAAGELAGFIYKNPVTGSYETADAYLSGNVKAKLKEAEDMATIEPEYETNVTALKAVQPADKEDWQISTKLGSSLVQPEVYAEFTKHLFGQSADIEVIQSRATGEWTVREKDKPRRGSIKKNTPNIATWGINRLNFKGINIMQKVMNNKSLVVVDKYKEEGREIKVTNAEQTALVQEKAERMKEEFTKWLREHNGGETLKAVVKYYNDVYNTDVLREFDGSHLPDTFDGMNPK